MKPTAPSVYFTAGRSINTYWVLPLQKSDSEGNGEKSWWIGAAYEYSPHLSIEMFYTRAHPKKSYRGIPLESKVDVIGWTFTYLGY